MRFSEQNTRAPEENRLTFVSIISLRCEAFSNEKKLVLGGWGLGDGKCKSHLLKDLNDLIKCK